MTSSRVSPSPVVAVVSVPPAVVSVPAAVVSVPTVVSLPELDVVSSLPHAAATSAKTVSAAARPRRPERVALAVLDVDRMWFPLSQLWFDDAVCPLPPNDIGRRTVEVILNVNLFHINDQYLSWSERDDEIGVHNDRRVRSVTSSSHANA